MKATVLLAEDEKSIREGLSKILVRQGYDVITAKDGQEALETAGKREFHLLITDLVMPNLDGFALMLKVRELKPDAQVIIITAYGTIEKAVEALKAGVYDFLVKPLDMARFKVLVSKALEKQQLILENRALYERLKEKYGLANIIAKSSEMLKVMKVIKQAGPHRTTVLITGESGTGKELVANAIYLASPRVEKPFIKVNCSALAEGVLESELFGHEKGAFTGAIADKPGRFELADKGTIFLDEIGELSPAVQVKLLRFLQEREFERVGGTKTLKVDVRVIAATNIDLKQAVEQKKFREDLYYRLNVVNIQLPPLRDRKVDLPFLVDHFVHKFNKDREIPIKGVSRKAYQSLIAYDWPGNVRELENCIESAMILVKGDYVQPKDLPPPIQAKEDEQDTINLPVGTSLEEAEKVLIQRTLSHVKGNRTEAARILGASVRTVQRKVTKHGLE